MLLLYLNSYYKIYVCYTIVMHIIPLKVVISIFYDIKRFLYNKKIIGNETKRSGLLLST